MPRATVLSFVLILGTVACDRGEATTLPPATTAPSNRVAESDAESRATATASSRGASVPAAIEKRVCDPRGDYRLRFRSNGSEGWWLRFAVAGTPPKAELAAPATMLGLESGALETTVDATGCGLRLRADTGHAGTVAIAIALEPTTGKVSGTLTRTRTVAAGDSPAAVTGFRGRNAAPPGRECVVPGVYRVTFAAKHRWTNAEPRDDRSCKADILGIHLLPQDLRVEWLGDELAVDRVVSGGAHWEETFGEETVAATGCDVELGVIGDSTHFAGKLTFGGGKASGIATTAKVQVIEGTDEAENIWDCEARQIPMTAKRIEVP